MLWEVPLGNHGHSRNVIGQLAEELTAAYVGGRRHKSDSTKDYCPDVSVWKLPSAVRYYESKAVGVSNQAFVYAGRLEKDRAFVNAGHSLTYVIWQHATTVKGVETVEQLRRLVLASVRTVYMLDFEALSWVCSHLEAEPLNSKYGGSDERPEYGSGYRVNLSLLKNWITNEYLDGLTPGHVQRWIMQNEGRSFQG